MPLPRFLIDRIPQTQGMTYGQFSDQVRAAVATADVTRMDENALALHEYTVLNMKRSDRIEKTCAVSDAARSVLAMIDEPQLWMVLTEPWCGDSAQILPFDERPLFSMGYGLHVHDLYTKIV